MAVSLPCGVSELTTIRNDLPAMGAAQYGRVDQGAVAMLLAKLYLNAGVYTGTTKWAEALTEAQRVIAGPYRLDPNFRRMFSADNNTSPEIIFAIEQDGDKIQTWGGMTFLIHAEVGASMNAGDFGIDGGWWGIRTKPSLAALYPGNGGPTTADKRGALLTRDGFSGSMTNLTDYTTGIGVTKYTNKTSTGAAGKNSTFVDTDFPVFRLADAYLMYAEASLRGGGGSRATALGYINALRDRAALRAKLGYRADERVILVSVGGTRVGRSLLRKCAEAFTLIASQVPETRLVLVGGPRLAEMEPARGPRVEVRDYVPDLFEHHAAADLAIVQGGLTTTMELAALRTPFLYFPLRNHFEQQLHVARRLDRLGAGVRLDYERTSPEALGAAMLEYLGKPVHSAEVPVGGTDRAAQLIADLL